MPELFAKSALSGFAPVTHVGTTLAEAHVGPITSIALFPGQESAGAKALKPLGLGFPAPNRSTLSDDTRLVWTGHNQAFLIGADAPAIPATVAAVTDQTDGWCALTLAGPVAADALMRYVAIDLRPDAFPPNATVRTALNHIQMVLVCTAPDTFLILIFRSMARTAWHELEIALHQIAARASLA